MGKKISERILISACLCILVFLSACGGAPAALDLPAPDAVTQIGITAPDGTETTVADKDAAAAIMSALNGAKPTRKASVNDQPVNVASFWTVRINAGDKTTVIYYYEKDGAYYAEQPYNGIFRLNADIEDLIG